MYSVFARLEEGESVFVASRQQLGQALQLVHEFKTHWPREYVVRDSEGKEVDLNRISPENHS